MAESHPQSLLDALRPRLAAVAALDVDAPVKLDGTWNPGPNSM